MSKLDNNICMEKLRYGKLLHSKDEMKRIEFETRSLAYYYDFKPFFEVYDAARKIRMGL